MHSTFSLGLLLAVAASALPQPQTSTDATCQADALETATWTNLGMDTFLADWAKANVTEASTNNVQKLASSFGAPNFFCGIDNFCNAGQPCQPVTLPAWYSLLAIQNWNSYMNNINTAVTFASSILGLQLPQMVTDLGVSTPADNVTPFNKILTGINTILALVPFTGTAAAIGQSTLTTSIGYILSLSIPPSADDKFLEWSNVASSLGTAVQQYQSAVTTTITSILNAPLADETFGIFNQIEGGRFLGTSENFTQSDLQSKMIDSFKLYAAGLVLQAQHVYVNRVTTYVECGEDGDAGSAVLCVDKKAEGGNYDRFYLYKTEGDGTTRQTSIADNLISKYGLTKEKILEGTYKCFVNNNRVQLPDTFVDSLPIDPATDCLFMLQVCDLDDRWDQYDNIGAGCRDLGLTLE